jgi:predicted transcriptional regulator
LILETDTRTGETKMTKTTKTAKMTKVAAKKEAPAAKKEGLRKPQVRILAALNKHGGMPRTKISEKAPVDLACCTEYIGSDDEATRKANDKSHFPSLLTLGFVSAAADEGPTQYAITPKGRAALKTAGKEAPALSSAARSQAVGKK